MKRSIKERLISFSDCTKFTPSFSTSNEQEHLVYTDFNYLCSPILAVESVFFYSDFGTAY